MHRWILGGWLVASSPAWGLDVCPSFQNVYSKAVEPKIRSGIPFKLLSIAAGSQDSWRRLVLIRYDLWNELVTLEIPGKVVRQVPLTKAAQDLCSMLSLPEVPRGAPVYYRLLLNPDIEGGVNKLPSQRSASFGLLNVNWQRVVKDLANEKVIMEGEMNP